jgi:hypothetical protein
MADHPNPIFAVEPNPVSFGQVPQKDVRVRIVRMTNLLGEGVRISIAPRTIRNVPPDQPPSGFFWAALKAEIPFSGSRDFPIEFMPRAEAVFKDTVEVHIKPKGIVKGDVVKIKLLGKGLPIEVQPF